MAHTILDSTIHEVPFLGALGITVESASPGEVILRLRTMTALLTILEQYTRRAYLLSVSLLHRLVSVSIPGSPVTNSARSAQR